MTKADKPATAFLVCSRIEFVMDQPAISSKIVLTDEEKKRLVAYFNVLIEMDLVLKKSHCEEKKSV